VPFKDDIEKELQELRRAGLQRQPRTLGSPQQPEILIDGSKVVGLCSNNYLGLANHPAIVAAAVNALQQFGVGAAASRQVSGTMGIHLQAEQRLQRFAGTEACILFSTGYAANTGAIQALAGSSDVVFSDTLNHASIIDGCRLSRARVKVYRHCDPGHLENLMLQHRRGKSRALVVSEAVFSMDGDMAPLEELRAVCDRFDAALLVDEAHSLGVLGPGGRGLCALRRVPPDVLVGTLGKAFGAAGGFVASRTEVVEIIRNKARSYFFSTAPLPAQAASALAAADVVEAADERRIRLLSHADRLRSALIKMGYKTSANATQIIPVHVGGSAETMRFSASLMDRNVFVQGIRPPSVPKGSSRLRLTPIATHEDEHIDRTIEAFRSLLDEYVSILKPK
jgi:8-amino-7-oxononanoate synthase